VEMPILDVCVMWLRSGVFDLRRVAIRKLVICVVVCKLVIRVSLESVCCVYLLKACDECLNFEYVCFGQCGA
jgi:hypothetical protein